MSSGVSSKESFCEETLSGFVDNYYVFSWGAPTSLSRLKEIRCVGPSKTKSEIELACKIATEPSDYVDYMDGCFRAFIQNFVDNKKAS